VAATGSGSDSPARTISGSNWRRYDWRLYDTARTEDYLPRAAGHHRTGSRRTVRPRDCSCAGLLSLASAQMAKPGSTPGARTGLSSQMGRPTTGPMSTLATGMRDTILHLRRAHPGWRPDTLLAELRVDRRGADHPLPSRSGIAALLKVAKLTCRYQKQSELPTDPAGRHTA